MVPDLSTKFNYRKIFNQKLMTIQLLCLRLSARYHWVLELEGVQLSSASVSAFKGEHSYFSMAN